MQEEEKKIHRCKVCNRVLKSKKAIEQGMGETCKRKQIKYKNKPLLKQNNIQINSNKPITVLEYINKKIR